MNGIDGNPKITRSCKIILKTLKEKNSLMSAQDLYAVLKGESHTLGLTTIYRSLDILLRENRIQLVTLQDGERRYEVIDPGEHHHHLICSACKTNVHLEQCFVDNLEEGIERRHGFVVKSHILEIFGLCKDCAPEGS